MPRKGIREDLTGQQFGSWTVLGFSHRAKSRTSYWLCQCKCGHRQANGQGNLKAGATKQCKECSRQKNSGKGNTQYKHGSDRENKTYGVWQSMRTRCNNPNSFGHKWYGAKGITVCERWNDYENFLSDMGDRPSNKHQLDRIDNQKGYSPDNCRWVTRKKNCRNRSSSKMISYKGKTMCISDWAEETGIPFGCLSSRLKKPHWTIEQALTTPVRKSKPPIIT